MKNTIRLFTIFLITAVVAVLSIYLLSPQPYFSQFQTTDEVETFLVGMFQLDESYLEDVLEVAEDPRYGLRCNEFREFSAEANDVDGALDCFANTEKWSANLYAINFQFSEQKLTSVSVDRFYSGG